MERFTCVYILQSELGPQPFYAGITDALRDQLRRHNAGEVPHTSRYRLWHIKTEARQRQETANPDASGQIIFQRYRAWLAGVRRRRQTVTEKGAKAWFAITPESTKAAREKAERERQAKIVAFPAKAAA